MTTNHTPGPWIAEVADGDVEIVSGGVVIASIDSGEAEYIANARLIAAAPTQHEEMLRYLPIIERAEADAGLWARLAEGTGIATANGYRAAIAKATGGVA